MQSKNKCESDNFARGLERSMSKRQLQLLSVFCDIYTNSGTKSDFVATSFVHK